MRPVVTAAEMRALDHATIDDVGIPALALMETAGRAVADAARRMVPGGHVAVVCGPGNNGGDGFVCARVLRERGLDAVAYLAVARTKTAGDAKAHLDILERGGGVVRMIDTPAELAELAGAIAGAALVVDALFGIGMTRAIEGHLGDVVAAIGKATRVLAVDIPSGLDADTGKILGRAVHAERTVAMGALKVALVGAPGFAHCGDVEVAEIGIPRGLIATSAVGAGFVELGDIARALPRPSALDHKGTRGHVLIVAGMPGFRGAGRLCAEAAARAGAGLVTLAASGDVSASDSIMTRSVDGALGELLAGKAAIAIGPGLGQSDIAAAWLGEVLASGLPAVLDADALNLCAGIAEALRQASGPLILTPHPGEAARLLGTTVAAIEADRLAAARALASQTRAVIVLKGARTVVCDGALDDGYCTINPTGGPELATGGSGDVLTGAIAALLAQGLSPGDAARVAVYVHGAAGARAAERSGTRGVMSADLPLELAAVLREIPRPA